MCLFEMEKEIAFFGKSERKMVGNGGTVLIEDGISNGLFTISKQNVIRRWSHRNNEGIWRKRRRGRDEPVNERKKERWGFLRKRNEGK